MLSSGDQSGNLSKGTFSEGLAELLTRHPATTETDVVVSSDIIGPTWFPEANDVELSERLTKAPPLPLREALERAARVSTPSSAWLDPRWGLSERAARLLTDIEFVRQAPVLNILNGFEIAMRSIIAVAGKTSKIDNVLRDENQVTRQELVVGRMRRCVALMCYSLIDTFVWKDRMARAGDVPGIPPDVDYRSLASLVKRRCDAFLRGDEVTSSRGSAIVSLTTFASLLAAGGIRNSGTKLILKGTFYEVVLGGHDASLQRVVAAEYNNLLEATDEAERREFFAGMKQNRLEKMANGIIVEGATEDEKKWSKLEQNRRLSRQAGMLTAERSVPIAVTIKPTLSKGDRGEVTFDTGSLESLYRATANGTVPFATLASTKKVLHANFDVSYNPYFSFYTLWNWMFLSSGALFNSPSNPMTKNLLVGVLTKDMHAILLCPRCHEGFVAKNEETCRLLEYTKEGLSKLKMDLQDALYAMTLRDSGGDVSENELFRRILTHEDERNVAQLDSSLKNMKESHRKAYAIRAIGASRGMAAIGLYSLLSSVKREGLHDKDIEQVQLLNRWTLSQNVIYLITNEEKGSAVSDRERSTKAFIGLWALRNAVRIRRDVTDPTNHEAVSTPSSPVPLSTVLRQKTRFDSTTFRAAPYVADFKNQFVEVLSVFKDDLICAKRGEKRSRASDYYKFGERLTSNRAVEPLGTYKLKDRLKASSLVLSNDNDNTASAADNPSLVIGEVALPKETLDGLSKRTYTYLEVFPVTVYDI